MIFEKAIVDDTHAHSHNDSDKYIWVTSEIKTSCGSCQQNKDCGTGVLAKLMAKRTNRALVKCEHAVNKGDLVTIAIPESNLVIASALLYLLPLMNLFLGLWIGSSLQLHELAAFALGLLGIVLGCLFIRFFGQRIRSLVVVPYVVNEAQLS